MTKHDALRKQRIIDWLDLNAQYYGDYSRNRDEDRRIDGNAEKALREFIAERDSFYLGTATRDGQPYIQHRGGPRGFLKVLDDNTLAFADFERSRQIVVGKRLELF